MKKQNSALTLLLLVFLACAAFVVAYFFLPHASGGENGFGEAAIALKLEGSPYVAGNTAAVRALSTCGAFGLFLDGKKFGAGESYFGAPLALTEGRHSFFAESEGCNASLSFEALARECSGSQTTPCEAGGCIGIRRCESGIYSKECALPKKVCVPGERIGCSADGCKFGYAICNPCGTGFGKCANDGAINSGNSNLTCSEGACG